MGKAHITGLILMFLWAILRMDGGSVVTDNFIRTKSCDLPTAQKGPPFAPSVKRNNIVFILGEDSGSTNQYYLEATKYYEQQSQGRSLIVVDSCRSLKCVMQYLQQKRPTGSLPWGSIELVVHGNPWTGLSMPVIPGGPRLTSAAVHHALEQGVLPPFCEFDLDNCTTVCLNSCGTGDNDALVDAFQTAFKSQRGNAHIKASNKFVFYGSFGVNEYVQKKWDSDYYFAFYKTGYRPGDIVLARRLSKRYPDVNINWRTALNHEHITNDSGPFHQTFNVPIKWTVTYPDTASRPELIDQQSRVDWLKSQSELMNKLKMLGIPVERFR